MTIVLRRFAASPKRLSSDVWKEITKLICQSDATANAEFSKVAGMGSCLLNDKLFAENPLVVVNKGPRLRVYCLYGEDAISGEDADESALSWKPTENEWTVFMPCSSEECTAFKEELAKRSSKFVVYDIAEGLDVEKSEKKAEPSAANITIDWEAFKSL